MTILELQQTALTRDSEDRFEKRLIIVGAAGQQGHEYFKLLQGYKIVALIDTQFDVLQKLYKDSNIPLFSTIQEVLDCPDVHFNTAMICVPHHFHLAVTLPLAQRDIMIIKEKPLAIKIEELMLYRKHNFTKIYTTVQRNFNEIFQKIKQDMFLLGKIYNFKYEYYLKVMGPSDGWRGNFYCSGGGVVIDMGYHIIDMILSLFGSPSDVDGGISYCYDYSGQSNLEDSASILFRYPNHQLHGVIHLNRHFNKKMEQLEIIGSNGIMHVTPSSYSVFNREGEIMKEYHKTENQDKRAMMDFYLKDDHSQEFESAHFNHHAKIVEIIDKFYKKVRTI